MAISGQCSRSSFATAKSCTITASAPLSAISLISSKRAGSSLSVTRVFSVT